MIQTSLSDPAVLLIGHGTRRPAGVAEFHALVEQLRQALPQRTLLAGFLELTEPSLTEALETLRQQGFRRITALPAFLMAAGHIKNDIPVMLDAFQAKHPGLKITLGADLGVHSNLLHVARERIESSEAAFGPEYDRRETVLLVIGRGSSDLDANSNISKIAQILWEGMGFGWAATAYTAVAAPSVADALERVHRLGFRQVVVFPYLLFNGCLIERIQATVAEHGTAYPAARTAVAPYLNVHPLLVETFVERLAEAETGAASMNCQFCAYRTAIVGREEWRGVPPGGLHSAHPHPHGQTPHRCRCEPVLINL